MYSADEMDMSALGSEGRWWQIEQWSPQWPKDVQVLIPGTYEYVTLRDKGDLQI